MTSIEFFWLLPFLYFTIDVFQFLRYVIRVGAFDDKISEIGITDLLHDLVDFPIFTGLVLITIGNCPIIVVLSQHKLQDVTDHFDLPINNDDGL